MLPSILFSFPAFFLSSGSTSRIKELKEAYPSFQLSSPVGIETLHLSAPSEFMSNTRKLSENFLTTLKRREIVINDTSQNNVKETMCFGASYSPQRSLLQVKWVCFDETWRFLNDSFRKRLIERWDKKRSKTNFEEHFLISSVKNSFSAWQS